MKLQTVCVCTGGLRSPAPGTLQFWEPPGQSLVKFGVITQQLSQETSERDANTALLPTLHVSERKCLGEIALPWPRRRMGAKLPFLVHVCCCQGRI